VPDDPRRTIVAGRVGRPHGLDGSFHVIDPTPVLIEAGSRVIVDGRELTIVRRAGDDRRPLVRLEGVDDREAAEALRGHELMVDRVRAPELPDDEWWPDELEGCAARDGERSVGTVRRVLTLPSCEVLEIERPSGEPDLLVPLIRDAVRAVDVDRREIDVDLRFLGER
jgi:16S rRNA processing protein RimM